MSYAMFQVAPRGSNQTYDCSFHTLATGISPRHSDTVDVKFMVGDLAVVISLPHASFADFKKAARRPLTDRESIEAAGMILKGLLERGLWSGEAEYRPTKEESLTALERAAANS
ncbi:MAG: hypothetical protein EXQ56_13705 [Acidobacteria bacterium]|nr:hypothetical protein [Acidobacteriota bacterium]